MTEREKQSHSELIRLIQENPDLPVVAMVDGELGGEEYCWYLGAWGSVEIDEYVRAINYDNGILLKSDGDIIDTLERYFDPFDFDELPDSDEECKKIYDDLPWTRAIMVQIKIPD